MSLRFLAGSLGIPFIPTKSGLGTDLLNQEGFSPEVRKERKVANKKFALMQNPFNGREDPVVLPALNPDVALLHAQYVGEDGTVRIKGLTFADVEQAKSADIVIVSCEEIVPTEFIRMDPDQNSVPPFLVDAVIKFPYGAHPTACAYFYDYDVSHLNLYKDAAKDRSAVHPDMLDDDDDEWITGVTGQEELSRKNRGAGNLVKIKANPVMGYAPGLDRR